jgi:hypothetical protein
MISHTHLRRNHALIYYVVFPLLVCAGIALTQIYQPWGLILPLCCIFACSWIVSRFDLHSLMLLLLAFVLPFSFEYHVTANFVINMPSEPMLAVILISIGWECLKKPDTLRQLLSGESRWVIPILVSYVLFTLFSEMKVVSVKFTTVMVTYIVTFYSWQKYQCKRQSDLFVRSAVLFSLAVIVIYIYSLWQLRGFDWNPVTTKGIYRPFFRDHTIFGASSAILAIFWLFMTRTAKTNTNKLIYFTAGLIFVSAVVVSNSRAAFLSLLFSGIVGLLFVLNVRAKVLLAGILVIIGLAFAFKRSVFTLLRNDTYVFHNSGSGYVERIESSADIGSDVSNRERLNRWVSGIGMFSDKPFTGFGPGTYQFTYIPYQDPALINRLSVKDPWHIPENSGGTAHSEYILALSETGILGFIAFIVAISRWVWLAFQHSYKCKERDRIIIQVAFTALSTYIFHAFFNNFLNTDKFAFLFWGLAAWMSAHYELNISKQNGVLS